MPLPPPATEFVLVDTVSTPNANLAIIKDEHPLPVLPLDAWFGDLFKRIWKEGVKDTTKPQGNFLAQTRTATQPAAPYKPIANPTDTKSKADYTQGVARDWSMMTAIERVNAYGYRGDDRAPDLIRQANGFFPPSSRTDDYYIKNTVYGQFNGYLQRRFKQDIKSRINADQFLLMVKQIIPSEDQRSVWVDYTIWREIVKSEELHLGRMIADQAMKGYISTTFNPKVAARFAKGKGFIYFMRVKGAFVVPPTGKHLWAVFAEDELAQPGPVLWEDIVAYRDLTARKIWFRRTFMDKNPSVYKTALQGLSTFS